MFGFGEKDTRAYVHGVCYRDDDPEVYYYLIAKNKSHDECREAAKAAGMGKKWMLFWADFQIPEESKAIADANEKIVYRRVHPRGDEIDRFLQPDTPGAALVPTDKAIPVRTRVRTRTTVAETAPAATAPVRNRTRTRQ